MEEERDFHIGATLAALEPDADIRAAMEAFASSYGVKLIATETRASFVETVAETIQVGGVLFDADFDGIATVLVDFFANHREIPIFLRCRDQSIVDHFRSDYSEMLLRPYEHCTEEVLSNLVAESIFGRHYPGSMLEHVQETICSVVCTHLAGVELEVGSLLLASDRRVYGERLEVMPIRSSWCRGAMMLESRGSDIMRLVRLGRTRFASDVHHIANCTEDLLRELMNQISGAFKNKFVPSDFQGHLHQIEVPMTINHREHYVSFGGTQPLLCFKLKVRDVEGDGDAFDPFDLFLRLSFHGFWDVDGFSVNADDDDGADSGVLELF